MSAREIVSAVDARTGLIATLTARGIAASKFASAQVAFDRAGELLTAAESRLRQFAGLDREISQASAAAIVSWAANGGEKPSQAPDAKSDDQLRKRDAAEHHAGAARSAAATLGQALKAAEEALRDADRRISASATAVLVQEAAPLAERLLKARCDVWALEASLSSLSTQWFPTAAGVPRPVELGKAINEAIVAKEPPWRAPFGATPEVEAWRELHAALCRGNVDAKLEPTP